MQHTENFQTQLEPIGVKTIAVSEEEMRLYGPFLARLHDALVCTHSHAMQSEEHTETNDLSNDSSGDLVSLHQNVS